MKKHDYIIIASIVFFIVENIYFGFNATAQSGAEHVADYVCVMLTFWGFLSMVIDRERVKNVVTLEGVWMLPPTKKKSPKSQGIKD